MNDSISQQHIRILFDGDESPGFSCYALIQRTADSVSFPVKIWNYRIVAKCTTLEGPGWKVLMWDCKVVEWPSDWLTALEDTLSTLVSGGAEVAWIGLGELFAEPPALFEPDSMSGGILLASSKVTGLIAHRTIDGSLMPITDEEMARLRLNKGLKLG